MKYAIVGTAGHVDHGKTSLIESLTGTNTDRLIEEQQRGMTIDLGFACLKLPDGSVAGIVDVPGHERFLKNMLAGATGVDLILLVIAADEGVMPQTVEHLEILKLLDISSGIVVLTKCDMVERDWLDVVEQDVKEQLAGSFLEKSAMIRVSSLTGRGINELKRQIFSAVSRCKPRDEHAPVRLPIDRVFSPQGVGIVVTGTLIAGTVRVGDTLEVLPERVPARVRGLQTFSEKVASAKAGMRVALNLTGLDGADLQRGCQLAAPGSLAAAECVEIRLTLLEGNKRSLKDGARVRFYTGTSEFTGRIRILDSHREVAEGETAIVQFVADNHNLITSNRGDRFIVRSYSPMITLGGGVVLEVSPVRVKKNDAVRLAYLEAASEGDPTDILLSILNSNIVGATLDELKDRSRLSDPAFADSLQVLISGDKAAMISKDRALSSVHMGSIRNRFVETLSSFHDKFPLRPGMPREELRQSIVPGADVKIFNQMLAFWQNMAQPVIDVEGGTVRLRDFRVTLSERQQSLLSRIVEYYADRGIDIPTLREVSSMVRAPQDAIVSLLKVGVSQSLLFLVADGEYYAASVVENCKRLIATWLIEHETISVGEFRDLARSNRKSAMQLLEFLDLQGVTVRRGDQRMFAVRASDPHK